MAATRALLFALFVLALLETTACAESSLEILGNLLFQEGLGGKQVIDGGGDQHLELYEPMLFLDLQLSETTSFHLSGTYDSFTSASARIFDARSGASASAAHLVSDAATGASGTPVPTATPVPTGTPDPEGTPLPTPTPMPAAAAAAEPIAPRDVWEQRQAVEVGLAQKLGTWVIAPSGGYSFEADYESRHGGLNLQKSFAEDNFTVSLGAFYYQDAVLVYDLAAGAFTGWTPRLTRSVILSASQILGPADLVLVGGSFTRQTGYLASSRNTVVVPQGRTQEVLPDGRSKWTGTLRYVHGFSPGVALHLDYRYYADDWGVSADTFEPSLAFGSEDELDLVRIAYRFYVQQGTKYYAESFPAAQGYLTSDSDLAGLEAREVRLHFSHRWETVSWLQDFSLNGTLAYYVRDNGLRAWIFQLGLGGAL